MSTEARSNILLLATGGTIAGAATADDPARYRSGEIGPAALLAELPGAAHGATISTEEVCALGSQDISDHHWRLIAQRIVLAFGDPRIDAIVVTHGTDTMEETALFLDLVLPPTKPVVMVGATRAATATGADGPANLVDALQLACHPAAAGLGIVVVGDGAVLAARDVQKIRTTSAAAFAAIGAAPLGLIEAGRVYLDGRIAPKRGALLCLPAGALPRVEIVHAYAGVDGAAVEDAVARGAKGIVLAGVGRGNASAAMLDALRAAAAAGVVVVRASRVAEGFASPGREIDDEASGFLVALGHPPAKARVLTQLMIAQGIDGRPAQQLLFDKSRVVA